MVLSSKIVYPCFYATTPRPARSRPHPRYQLPHAETMDLSRQTQNRQNSRRPPPCPRIRNRPPDSRFPQPRRTLFPPRQFPQNQRTQPARRPRHRHQIQRPARANHPGHRRAAHHLHHHRRRRQRNAPQARRTRRRPGQIHRSHDPPRLTPMLEVKFNPTRVCRARLLFTLTKEGRRAVCTPNGLKARAPLLVLFCSFFFSTSVHAQTLRIAAAADLQFVLPDLASQYEKQTGAKVAITYGSSGNFFAQIQNGAPFDLFFSADIDYPKRLEAAGLAEPGTLYPYATGKIVLWAPNESKLDLSRGLQVLLNPGIRKIAIANPEHAPYGRAAVAALRRERIYDQVATKFVLGENISQTASFVAS